MQNNKSDIKICYIDSAYDTLSNFINRIELVPNISGHQFNDPKSYCNDRICGDFEIIYVLGGENVITIEDKSYHCFAGDFILIPPFTKNSIMTTKDNPHNNYFIHFDVLPLYKHAEFIRFVTGSKDDSMRIHIGENESLLNLFKFLERESMQKREGFNILFKTILIQIITIIIRINFANNTSKAESANETTEESSRLRIWQDIVDKSICVISDRINEVIILPELCDSLNISESYLFKVFRRVLGVSPAKFIQFMKIKRAEQILRTEKLPISEIAFLLGFSSPYHFSNVFKMFFKMPPSQYLKLKQSSSV